jgi:hypothetical protein
LAYGQRFDYPATCRGFALVLSQRMSPHWLAIGSAGGRLQSPR